MTEDVTVEVDLCHQLKTHIGCWEHQVSHSNRSFLMGRLTMCKSIQLTVIYSCYNFGIFRQVGKCQGLKTADPVATKVAEDREAAEKVYDELLKLDSECQQLQSAIWTSKEQLHLGLVKLEGVIALLT